MRRPTLLLLRRWLLFNAAGLGGAALQLLLLRIGMSWAGLSYLAASTIAIESAVLHNFIWHEKLTWRDETASTALTPPGLPAEGPGWVRRPRSVWERLLRFQLANGLLSLTGNLLLAPALINISHIDPLLANLASIGVCSLANFSICQVFVFPRVFGGQSRNQAGARGGIEGDCPRRTIRASQLGHRC